jgi:hypothetical protein
VLLQLAAAAFAVGLLGGVHCLGMCGGIATALSSASSGAMPAWQLRLGYNLGRISSYAVAGAIAGSIGGAGMLIAHALPVQMAAYILANVMLIGLGLYLAGLSAAVSRLESAGQWIWRRLQPLMRHLLPADRWSRALALGALWGWLPCGLVYSVLTTAMLAGNPGGGAIIMAAFGLGTLPNLLAAGTALGWLQRLRNHRSFRITAGGLVAGLGVVGLVRAAILPDAIRQGVLCVT